MPVLGHAFVGLATARCTRPKKIVTAGAALWAPILVGLAYLPDIANQLAITAGLGLQQVATHSLCFALVASVVIAPLLARFTACSLRKAFVLSLFSIGFHVVLDILQSSNRQPWWPISNRHIRLETAIIPQSMYEEAAIFAALFVVFWVGYWFVVRWRAARKWRRETLARPHTPQLGTVLAYPDATGFRTRRRTGRLPYRRVVWAGRIVTVAILLSAGAVHYLREIRVRELETSLRLSKRGNYAAAFALVERAEQWPHVARSGRIEFAKAMAYESLGDRERAEQYYLASMEADPSYIWPVASLVELYASGREPLAERRRRAEPYLQRLRSDFARDKSQPALLRKLERQLADPPPPRTPPTKQARRPPPKN